MSDPVWDEAGETLTTLATDGSSFIVTYGLPAAGIALGAGIVLAVLVKFGTRVRGWLG